MAQKRAEELTSLIAACRVGDVDAKARLFEAVYEDLRQIAHRAYRVGSHGSTMQATVLANEAFVLLDRSFPEPPEEVLESRATFFRTVALAMRTLLRDYWRAKRAAKRVGDLEAGVLPTDVAGPDEELDRADFLALDEALGELESYNLRWYEVVMQRYFAGRSIEETAELLEMGQTTVKSDWALARAWLRRRLGG